LQTDLQNDSASYVAEGTSNDATMNSDKASLRQSTLFKIAKPASPSEAVADLVSDNGPKGSVKSQRVTSSDADARPGPSAPLDVLGTAVRSSSRPRRGQRKLRDTIVPQEHLRRSMRRKTETR